MPPPNATLQSHILATLRLISPVSALNVPKRRIGGQQDGGYVMLDDLEYIGVCYSLGIGPDVSWDHEMAEIGSHIFQYDHTVDGTPIAHPRFHYFRVGITHDDTIASGMKRLDTLIEENGHAGREDMILKIDIEGHEWNALDVLDTNILGGFRQILAEFHGLRFLDQDPFRRQAHRLFSKLRQTHEVVHVHANNYAGITTVAGVPIADCLEITYARRSDYSFSQSTELFPGPLDTANDPLHPDIFLGSFTF